MSLTVRTKLRDLNIFTYIYCAAFKNHVSFENNVVKISIKIGTVKLAKTTGPFKFFQVKFSQKTGLENDKCVFHKEKLNAIDWRI